MQVVCGLFKSPGNFAKALGEFRWSLRQNAAFWRDAVLYTDAEAGALSARWHHCFREVIIDRALPPAVDAHRKWCCKGWWAKCAVERFERVLYCDFDIYVRKPIDDFLRAQLVRGPRFIHLTSYPGPLRVVGCGVTFYDRHGDWDRFLELLYHKWFHDEKAWTETLGLTVETFPRSGLPMDPWIVHYNFRQQSPADREQIYIIHGISPQDDGRAVLRSMGYRADEIDFRWSWWEEAGRRADGYRRGLMSRLGWR